MKAVELGTPGNAVDGPSGSDRAGWYLSKPGRAKRYVEEESSQLGAVQSMLVAGKCAMVVSQNMICTGDERREVIQKSVYARTTIMLII